MAEYVELVASAEKNMGEVAAWLMKNARRMSEAMFFGQKVDWEGLTPVHLLALRAYTPQGVFSPTAKAGYLARSSGNTVLTELAEALFADDLGFVNGLPESLNEKEQLRVVLIQMTQMAYKLKIRPADSRVKSM